MAALAAGAAPKLRELKVYRWVVATVSLVLFSLIFSRLPQAFMLERDRQIKKAPLYRQLQLLIL